MHPGVIQGSWGPSSRACCPCCNVCGVLCRCSAAAMGAAATRHAGPPSGVWASPRCVVLATSAGPLSAASHSEGTALLQDTQKGLTPARCCVCDMLLGSARLGAPADGVSGVCRLEAAAIPAACSVTALQDAAELMYASSSSWPGWCASTAMMFVSCEGALWPLCWSRIQSAVSLASCHLDHFRSAAALDRVDEVARQR